MPDFKLVGSADIHDATIVSLEQSPTQLLVRLTSIQKSPFQVRFSGVREVLSYRPEGMILQSLIRDDGSQPPYRFTFVNWYVDEKDNPKSAQSLEVVAELCYVDPGRPSPRFPEDFHVKYRFLSADEGGRRTGPPRQSYKGDWAYEGEDLNKPGAHLYMIWPLFEDASGQLLPDLAEVLPEGTARMFIANDELRQTVHRERIKVGTRGYFMEGRRRVAEAQVTRIVALHEARPTSHD
jgi:hypothetical protein